MNEMKGALKGKGYVPSLDVAQTVTAPRSSYTADGKCTCEMKRDRDREDGGMNETRVLDVG